MTFDVGFYSVFTLLFLVSAVDKWVRRNYERPGWLELAYQSTLAVFLGSLWAELAQPMELLWPQVQVVGFGLLLLLTSLEAGLGFMGRQTELNMDRPSLA